VKILEKIPQVKEIAPVYAVSVAILYTWALLHFFWRLPSWMLFSSMSDLTVIFFYMVTINFLESILLLFPPLVLSVVLPRKWFYDKFISRGISLIISILLFFIFLNNRIQADSPFPLELVRLRSLPFILMVILAFAFLMDQIGFLRKILMELADRLVVFLYISIPVSIVALLVVLIRNIF